MLSPFYSPPRPAAALALPPHSPAAVAAADRRSIFHHTTLHSIIFILPSDPGSRPAAELDTDSLTELPRSWIDALPDAVHALCPPSLSSSFESAATIRSRQKLRAAAKLLSFLPRAAFAKALGITLDQLHLHKASEIVRLMLLVLREYSSSLPDRNGARYPGLSERRSDHVHPDGRAFSDASHANDHPTGRSITGNFTLLDGNLLDWACKHQPYVTLHSGEAETVAASTGCTHIQYWQQLLEPLLGKVPLTTMYLDSTTALRNLTNPIHTTHKAIVEKYNKAGDVDKLLKVEK
ncbi:hypothetical protein RI054_15g74330 [Pseudoscourfieldia marina]